MKKYIAILFVALIAFACAGKQQAKAPEADVVTMSEEVPAANDSLSTVTPGDSLAPAPTEATAQ
jgi:uncharacterized protein YcfL